MHGDMGEAYDTSEIVTIRFWILDFGLEDTFYCRGEGATQGRKRFFFIPCIPYPLLNFPVNIRPVAMLPGSECFLGVLSVSAVSIASPRNRDRRHPVFLRHRRVPVRHRNTYPFPIVFLSFFAVRAWW